jgi:dethiobiotin synthetase
MKSFFVTGTDTDAGKTVAAKALLNYFAGQRLSTLAMKPVASGCFKQRGRWVNDDALALREVMTMDCDYSLTNPYSFEPAIAPHIAATEQNIEITEQVLIGAFNDVRALKPDVVVIEGAGGWELPLSDTLSMPTFVKQTNAEVVLVVGLKLGCLNHAVLTERAIRADGMRVAGWVAVDTQSAEMPYREQNIATLTRRLTSPCLGILPYTPDWRGRDLSTYINDFCR